ncbi:MAG: AMP-binding protein [Bacillota bacterium]|nr:AMP-binding protein [Bacillota bacterium]
MQEMTGRRLYEGQRHRTILDMLRRGRELYRNSPAYMFRRRPNGRVYIRTYEELVTDVEALGTALMSLGFADAFIAVTGENSYEWAVAYNAVCCGVGVIVPLDRMLPEVEVVNLAQRARVRAMFVTPKLVPAGLAALESCPGLERLIVMDPVHTDEKPYEKPDDDRIVLYSDLLLAGYERLAVGDRGYLDRKIDENALAILLFTSGTTQRSKGVMLSHRNICANLYQITGSLEIFPGERCLSVLPLHHTFETTAGMFAMLDNGACICFMDGLRYLANNLVEWKINLMIGVPLLFENIYKRVSDRITESGKADLVRLMRPVGRALANFGFKTNRKLFKSVIDGLGGGLRLVVSGAAAIDAEIHQAFYDFGVMFTQGYGLTECSPVVSVGTVRNNVPGTVGPPLGDVRVRIDDSGSDDGVGEILVQSESVMLGYFEDEDETSAVLTSDGWLRTGDMGRFDQHGCLVITGRTKSMIVLTNGKKAFPEEIEASLNDIPGVAESIVWGEMNARETIDLCASLRLERSALPLEKRDDDEAVAAYLKTAIARINRDLPAYKAVRYFIFTEQDYIRTTTLKVKRNEENAKLEMLLGRIGRTMRELDGANIDQYLP